MGTIATAALVLVLVGVVVGAAAWDRSHGRKDEKWDDWQTIPAWTYPLQAFGLLGMIVFSIARRNWFGVAWFVGISVLAAVTQYRRRRSA